MRVSLHIILFVAATVILSGKQRVTSEQAELASFAQDIYRQEGINLPRSSFELNVLDSGERVFTIGLESSDLSLSQDLLQGFVTGGAVSQHARSPIDQIVLEVELLSSNSKMMVLRSTGNCCEELYNNRLAPDVFTEKCLWVNENN